MRKIPFVLSTVLSGLAASTAMAETLRYDHNGSAMLVDWDGKAITIRYDNPRKTLGKHGVRRGTILFEGKLDKLEDGTPYVDGDARVFRSGCAPTKYYVYGELRKGKDFTLTGAAPVLAKGGCNIVDNSHTSSNSKLLFTHVSSSSRNGNNTNASSGGFGWSQLCVTGVNSTLNLRTGPGTSYGRIGQLPANACDVISLNQCINGWCAVQRNIEVGWASSKFLKTR